MKWQHVEQVAQLDDPPVAFVQPLPINTKIQVQREDHLVTTLGPHKRLLPVGFQSGPKRQIAGMIAELDARIAALQGAKNPHSKPFQVPATTAEEILKQIYATLDFTELNYPSNLDEMRGALTYLSQKPGLNGDRGKVWVIWGGKRGLHRIRIGGRFSDAPDTADGEGAQARELTSDLPVLLLLRQEGLESSGWRGTPFYWPVLLAPKNTKTALFNSRAA